MNNEEFQKQLEYMRQQRDENTPKAISISEFQEKLFNKIFDAYISDDDIYNIIREVYREELANYVDDDRIYLKFHILYDYILKKVPRDYGDEYEVRIENVTFYIQGAGADRLCKNIKINDIVLFGGGTEQKLSRTGKNKLEDIFCSHKLSLFIYDEVNTEREDNNRFHTTYLLYYKIR